MITFKRIFISAVLFTLTYSLCAFDFSFNGIGYNIKDENGQKVAQITQPSSLPDYSGDIVIPAEVTYNGECYRVTSIDWYAFGDCEGLTSIELPNTITIIGGEAFYGCSGLTSLTLPNSVTTIESGAFSGCSSLQSVYIPASVNSIYRNVFSNCPALTSIIVDDGNKVYDSHNNCNAIIDKEEKMLLTGCMNTVIPSDVTSIGVGAFWGCTGLTSIAFPSGLSVINFDAFHGCSGLTQVDFPNGLWHIGESAFEGCSSLLSLNIPKRTTSIEQKAFAGCSSLESIVVHDDNYQYDSRNGCNAIIDKEKNVLLIGCNNTTIPNGITKIERYAFEGAGIVSMVIPNSVTQIGRNAFINCRNLQNINIPNSITKLENETFCGCVSLFSITIPNSVTSIGSSVFYGCENLRSVFIPSSVTKINTHVFAGCNKLVSVEVDEDNAVYDSRNGCNAIIETVSNKLIVGCKSTQITNTISTIANYAFEGISSLNVLEIPSSVTQIEDRAFEKCSGLFAINIPNSVTSIGEGCFEGCTNLTTVNLPDGIVSLENSIFNGCSSLKEILLPNSITSIGTSSFAGCTSLTSVILSNTLTTLGTYSFFGCTSLSSIEIPHSVTSIGYGAFFKCANLQSITIPSEVGSIGQYAFYKCNNLTSVTSEAITPAAIDDEVFTNSSNAILYVPEESVSSYSTAPGWRNFKLIKAIKTVQNYAITYNEPENGILIVAIDGEEIESGTMAKENSTLTILAIPYTDYVIESLKLNGNVINNSSSFPVTGPMNIEVTFVREDEDVDNIDIMSSDNQKDCIIFNLSGQRINNPQKGIYIKTGKKIHFR